MSEVPLYRGTSPRGHCPPSWDPLGTLGKGLRLGRRGGVFYDQRCTYVVCPRERGVLQQIAAVGWLNEGCGRTCWPVVGPDRSCCRPRSRDESMYAFASCQRCTYGGNSILLFFGVGTIYVIEYRHSISRPNVRCSPYFFLPGSLGLQPGTPPAKNRNN